MSPSRTHHDRARRGVSGYGVAKTSTTARELYDKMLELYPDRANPSSLWGSPRAVKG
jgi:hypothetical protein